MFNKEESLKVTKIELGQKEFYKQYDNITITPYFVIMLNKYYENNNMAMHLDFDDRVNNYLTRTIEYYYKKNYSKTIVDLYQKGIIVLNNQEYPVKDFYIVFEQKNKKYHLMGTSANYHNKNISYDRAVKLIDTTIFIKLIKNSLIENNKIIVEDINTLIDLVNNWDGKLHQETKETDAINPKIGITNNE